MNYHERALCFQCQEKTLIGILCMPQDAGNRGILFVVGGPQYRAGSHRQFTLLARQFASEDIPSMRFDYRGMGDSEGDVREFSSIDDDIRVAVDQFFQEVPEINEVVLWGLCDAASAAIFYARQDSRITGLVLLNPWVRTEQGVAKAYLKHYYLARLLDRQFWRKIITGQFAFFAAAQSFMQQIIKLIFQKKILPSVGADEASSQVVIDLPKKMADGLRLFTGRTLFILCGNDLTAQEFSDLAESSKDWKKLMLSSKISRMDLAGANHTFSRRQWREEIGLWTIDWIKKQ
ncbi:MAG: hydrolase 1, exosortase A system-associated [Pseudomonadota bacterium]